MTGRVLTAYLAEPGRLVLAHETPGRLCVDQVRVFDREGMHADLELRHDRLILVSESGYAVLALPEEIRDPVHLAASVRGVGWILFDVE